MNGYQQYVPIPAAQTQVEAPLSCHLLRSLSDNADNLKKCVLREKLVGLAGPPLVTLPGHVVSATQSVRLFLPPIPCLLTAGHNEVMIWTNVRRVSAAEGDLTFAFIVYPLRFDITEVLSVHSALNDVSKALISYTGLARYACSTKPTTYTPSRWNRGVTWQQWIYCFYYTSTAEVEYQVLSLDMISRMAWL